VVVCQKWERRSGGDFKDTGRRKVSVFKSSLLAHDQFFSAELRIITYDVELRDFSLR
jgi:hypothetical protein